MNSFQKVYYKVEGMDLYDFKNIFNLLKNLTVIFINSQLFYNKHLILHLFTFLSEKKKLQEFEQSFNLACKTSIKKWWVGGVMVKLLDCGFEVNEFKVQSLRSFSD